MLYNYKEAIKIYGTDYKLKKAITNQEIFKVESGIYSDKNDNYTAYELILKKYDNAFLVKDSALHFIGFISEEPEKIHLGTSRSALRIKDKRVQQHFYSNFEKPTVISRFDFEIEHILSVDNIKKYTTENNKNEIRLFNLKALLFDLLRDNKLYPKPVLIDLLTKFRDCSVFYDFDWFDIEECFYNENLSLDTEVSELVEEISSFAEERKWHREWDLD